MSDSRKAIVSESRKPRVSDGRSQTAESQLCHTADSQLGQTARYAIRSKAESREGGEEIRAVGFSERGSFVHDRIAVLLLTVLVVVVDFSTAFVGACMVYTIRKAWSKCRSYCACCQGRSMKESREYHGNDKN